MTKHTMQIHSSHFPPSHAHLNDEALGLRLTQLGLARAVIMAGCGGWGHLRQRGLARLVFLGSLVLANTKRTQGGVAIDNSFYDLDQSEKVPVSYHLGTGITKLFAEEHLNTPWVSHVSLYKNRIAWVGSSAKAKVNLYNPPRNKKAKEPDLVGYDTHGRPHILEAKGYSSKLKGSVLQHAINQVSQVSEVAGRAPLTRVACYHNLSTIPFTSRIVDPEHSGDGGCKIDWSFWSCVSAYYRIFIGLEDLMQDYRIGGRSYSVIDFIRPGLMLGVDKEILKSVKRGEGAFLESYAQRASGELRRDGAEEGFVYDVGPDGIVMIDHMSVEEQAGL